MDDWLDGWTDGRMTGWVVGWMDCFSVLYPYVPRRAGSKHVGVPSRLIICSPFKLISFKGLFNIYLGGARRNYFSVNIYASIECRKQPLNK
jgi:hypothetical protein